MLEGFFFVQGRGHPGPGPPLRFMALTKFRLFDDVQVFLKPQPSIKLSLIQILPSPDDEYEKDESDEGSEDGSTDEEVRIAYALHIISWFIFPSSSCQLVSHCGKVCFLIS